MSDSSPVIFGEGGVIDVNPFPMENTALPMYKLVPYQGLTAAKVAAIVNKQTG